MRSLSDIGEGDGNEDDEAQAYKAQNLNIYVFSVCFQLSFFKFLTYYISSLLPGVFSHFVFDLMCDLRK